MDAIIATDDRFAVRDSGDAFFFDVDPILFFNGGLKFGKPAVRSDGRSRTRREGSRIESIIKGIASEFRQRVARPRCDPG